MSALAGLVHAPATIERGQAISVLFASLAPDQARRLALLYPGLGNIDGVPFDNRYAGGADFRKEGQVDYLSMGVTSGSARAQIYVDIATKNFPNPPTFRVARRRVR